MTPEQAAQKYYWLKYDIATNTVEMYLDNHVLASSRICESMFYLEHLLNIRPKYEKEYFIRQDRRLILKPWFFTFGEYLHWCLEEFYKNFKLYKKPPVVQEWIDKCKKMWILMRMDCYWDSAYSADVNKIEDISGWDGVAGLLIQYYAYYMDMRLRVIDTEITFGYNKEVFIGEFFLSNLKYEDFIGDKYIEIINSPTIVKCYLTGRIDLLVDNGNKIGPVDHKHTHKFDGYEHEDFNPHDGICGYILAIHDILQKYKDQGLTNIPFCSGGWIYHISATEPPEPNKKSREAGKTKEPRFKTTPIDKNPNQLEDYKARQLSTFKRIAELLFNDKTPEWNTSACNSMFFRKCQYKPIHEQPSNEWNNIIKQFYTIGEPWDTRNHTANAGNKGEEKQ